MWKKLIAVAAIAVVGGAAGAVAALAADTGSQQTAPVVRTADVSRSAATATSQVLRVAANSDGTKVVGSKGTYVVRAGLAGRYEVGFPLDVSTCVGVASLANNDHTGSVPPSGSIGVAWRISTPNAFWVETRNVAGADTDADFTLVVTCKAPH